MIRATIQRLTARVAVRGPDENPPCCNPDHLLRGTQADNARDAVKRGRWTQRGLPGEANGSAKLVVAQVEEIRRRAADGASQRSLAVEFGVARSLVHRIVRREAWVCI